MKELATSTARLALVALLAAAPAAGFAQSGSPQQSVDAQTTVDGDDDCSILVDDAKADGEATNCDETGTVADTEESDGSLVEEDAKSDG